MFNPVLFRFASLFLLLTVGLFVYGYTFVANGYEQLAFLPAGQNSEYLTVAFLDVGQGDAIFIETPEGVQVLVDGGPTNAVLRELGKQMPILDRSLDLVIATHPDKDHIGGLVDVLDRYEVANIMVTNNESETTSADVFEYMVADEDASVRLATAGQVLKLGETVTLSILSPSVTDTSNWKSNASSIVAKLTYGDMDFMLTGDIPISVENYLVDTYKDVLESEVLKLAHHGSKTSSGASFLATVNSKYAVVSAGADNRYGHPDAKVLDRVETAGAEILNTAKQGTIVFKSDGERLWLEE